jgi:hypothetical protein
MSRLKRGELQTSSRETNIFNCIKFNFIGKAVLVETGNSSQWQPCTLCRVNLSRSWPTSHGNLHFPYWGLDDRQFDSTPHTGACIRVYRSESIAWTTACIPQCAAPSNVVLYMIWRSIDSTHKRVSPCHALQDEARTRIVRGKKPPTNHNPDRTCKKWPVQSCPRYSQPSDK